MHESNLGSAELDTIADGDSTCRNMLIIHNSPTRSGQNQITATDFDLKG
jgi:hypothetical protein